MHIPRSSGEPTTIHLPPGTTITKAPEQSTSALLPISRPRGRPPINRSGLDILKSPPRPRGRPPLDHSDGEAPRGRGRPPLDPSFKVEQRGRGRPPLSSPPSGAPRKRGRPPKNKNKLKKLGSPPPVVENENSNLVPKNSPANKRLRKSSEEDEEESVAKKQKLNGIYDCKVPELVNLKEETPGDDPSQVPSEQIKIPKKRGRQKGSKNAPKKLPFERNEEDVVKEKMASIVRNPKVKTTRELLECIQKESSLDNLRNKTLSSLGVDGDKSKNLTPSHKLLKNNETSDYDMTISKTEHIHKFLRSQNEAEEDYGHRSIEINDHRDVKIEQDKPDTRPHSRASEIILSGPVSEASVVHETIDLVDDDIIDVEKIDSAEDSPVKPKKCETVEEILAKLPVINHDEILWSDTESSRSSDYEPEEVIVTEEDVDDLHNKHIEGVNGNWNDGRLIQGLNHGLKVPIGNISIGDKDVQPNSKPNNLTDVDDNNGDDVMEQLDRNLNNLGVNEVNHDDNFREWQECVSKTSYNGELLHILPYVIID